MGDTQSNLEEVVEWILSRVPKPREIDFVDLEKAKRESW